MGRLMTAIKAGTSAFKESYMKADTQNADTADWNEYEARNLRYELLTAYYQGNAYRSVNRFAKKMKAEYGLYKHTRGIYNPAFRIGSFYRQHVWGGHLDAMAGNGVEQASALPIISDNKPLFEGVARLWRDSRWKINRNFTPLWGAVLGDMFLQVVDDPARGKVYINSIYPSSVFDVAKDNYGNIKSYVILERRIDPDGNGKTQVDYREEVVRDGDLVQYRLFKDSNPYSWGNRDSEGNPVDAWEIPYGFVPMVHIKHNDVGLDWGMSELQPKLEVFREIDDIGSKLGDQIRKTVDPPILFSGVPNPSTTPSPAGAAATASRPEPSREETPALYGAVGADAKFLVAPIDIDAVVNKIKHDLDLLEQDYPELALIKAIRSSGDITGVAIERLQEQSAQKVLAIRDTYDDALVRIHQMALSIGGMRGYDGYSAFNENSFASGDLDHQIGVRPVFNPTKSSELAAEKTRQETVKLAIDSGQPLATYLKKMGESDEYIQEIEASPEYQARISSLESLSMLNGGENG